MDDQKQENLERPHVVDGIKEFDNPLPSWWIGLFVFTIIFSFIYMAYYHFGDGTSLEQQLAVDAKHSKEQVMSNSSSTGQGDQQSGSASVDLPSMLKDDKVLAAGKTSYSTYCSPCHRPDMGGQIGPNLVDDFWLHGCSSKDIFKSIDKGIPDKGMAAWGPIMGEQKVWELTTLIISKLGSKPPNPKEPQGEECKWTP
ncbi:MAG: cbb3-type cytochrome c oxidase N-terminal domain-containing protein [Oligoflexales bacterium]